MSAASDSNVLMRRRHMATLAVLPVFVFLAAAIPLTLPNDVVLVIAGCLCAGLLVAALTLRSRPISVTAPNIVSLIALLVFFQDPLVMLLSRVFDGQTFVLLGSAVIAIKELALLGGVAWFGLRRMLRRPTAIVADLFALGLLALLALYTILPSELLDAPELPLAIRVIAARSIAVPALLYLLGRWAELSRDQFETTLRRLFWIGITSAVLGALLTPLPPSVWNVLGLKALLELKLGEDTVRAILNPSIGFPISFFLPDLPTSVIPWPGIRRLSTTVVEPLSAGFIFAMLFLVSRSLQYRRLTVRTLIFGLVTLLTLTRGGLFIAFVGYALIVTRRPRLTILVGAVVAAVVLAIYAFVLPNSPGVAGVNGTRFPALASGLQWTVTHPLGSGLGTASYLAFTRSGLESALSELGLNPRAAESFLSTVGVQLGIAGLLLCYGFMAVVVATLYAVWKRTRSADHFLSRAALGLSGAMLGCMLVSILSASGLSFVGVGLTFLLSGAAISAAQGNR